MGWLPFIAREKIGCNAEYQMTRDLMKSQSFFFFLCLVLKIANLWFKHC